MAAARRRRAAPADRARLCPELVLHPLPGGGGLRAGQHRFPVQAAAAGPAGPGAGNRRRAALSGTDLRAGGAQVRGRRRRRIRRAPRLPACGRGPPAPRDNSRRRLRCLRRDAVAVAGTGATGGRRRGGAGTDSADRAAVAPHGLAAPERTERGHRGRRHRLRAALRLHRKPELHGLPDPRRDRPRRRLLVLVQQGLQLHRGRFPGRPPAALRPAGHTGADRAAGQDPGAEDQPAAAVADARLVPGPGQCGRLRPGRKRRPGIGPDHPASGGIPRRRPEHPLPRAPGSRNSGSGGGFHGRNHRTRGRRRNTRNREHQGPEHL